MPAELTYKGVIGPHSDQCLLRVL